MTGWTMFFTLVGVAFLLAQFFRLLELLDRPARSRSGGRKPLPTAWNVLLWEALRDKPWMSWKS